MFRCLKTLLAFAMFFLFAHGGAVAAAAGHASAEEAVALVKSGIAYIKAHGPEAALKEFNDLRGKFRKGELYLTVYDMDGTSLANGANARLVGKNMKELKDADGVYILQERIKLVQAHGSGWHDFKWPNPASGKIEHKSMYSEKSGDLIVSCGVYK